MKKHITGLFITIYMILSLFFFSLGSTEAFADSLISAEISETAEPIFEKSEGQYYNYAPCYIQIDNETKYVFYCSNQISGEIVDYICWRKAVRVSSEWVWGAENIAFGPSAGSWDECHVCDPDVIQGSFTYNGHLYNWAMTYLGVAQWDCNGNQIGIAFADSIEGPWVKYENNPIICAPNTTSWGVGQDSMISLDNAGQIRIVYRYSDGTDDYCKYKDFDFSQVNNYTESIAYSVTRKGLFNGIAHTCSSHVAYDPSRQLYFMAAEHIWDESKRSCRETMIASISKSDFENGCGKWNIIYRFNQGNTGYASNHNASIARDSFGKLFEYNTLIVALSSSDNSGLWSFKINEAKLSLIDSNNSVTLENSHAYKLVNKSTGMVLDNWNTANGDACYLYEWTGVYNQQWIATSLGGNNYKLINRWSQKALDNYENNTPTIVYIWDDIYGVDQHWEITSVVNGYCKIKNIDTGRCLTAYENEASYSVSCEVYSGLDSQLWEIVDLGSVETSAEKIKSNHTYKLVNRLTGDVLDNWNSDNGELCYSYLWTGVDNQQWIITLINDSVYSIVNKWTGKALDSYDILNGSAVYIWDYVSGDDQQWTINSCGDGFYIITNLKSNLALTQSIQGNGNNLFCWNYVGDFSQQWMIVEV